MKIVYIIRLIAVIQLLLVALMSSMAILWSVFGLISISTKLCVASFVSSLMLMLVMMAAAGAIVGCNNDIRRLKTK